ncbi:MAG: ATP-binding cassette domain-containing protein [Candidatus Magasanikbacteria bacterium]|jgi:NitT/TauT family transport system ATP-binding protein
MPNEFGLEIINLSKSFDNHTVFDDFNLAIPKGEIIGIYGPNGCGKSTFLHLLAGIQEPDKGTIRINNKKPKEIKPGIVFQNYSDHLLPWKKTMENIFLQEKIQKNTRSEEMLDHLSDSQKNLFQNLYPYELSGGQQQLSSILRSLINTDDLILLDEPFSSLDQNIKNQAHDLILKNRQNDRTIVLVTHDLLDSVYLSDRIIVLKGTPVHNKYLNLNTKYNFKDKIDLLHSSFFSDIYKQTMEYIAS